MRATRVGVGWRQYGESIWKRTLTKVGRGWVRSVYLSPCPAISEREGSSNNSLRNLDRFLVDSLVRLYLFLIIMRDSQGPDQHRNVSENAGHSLEKPWFPSRSPYALQFPDRTSIFGFILRFKVGLSRTRMKVWWEEYFCLNGSSKEKVRDVQNAVMSNSLITLKY